MQDGDDDHDGGNGVKEKVGIKGDDEDLND